MNELPDPCRVAIAALEVPDELRQALGELSANNFTAKDLCLAGSPATIERAHTALADLPRLDQDFAPLMRNVEPLAIGPVDVPLVATSDRLLTWLKGSNADNLFNPGGRCWLLPHLRQGLVDRLKAGDVMLLAGPLASSRDLTLGTRILLRHSRHPVQSHEFARQRP